MSKDIRIGIIGCGKIATVSHAPSHNAVPGVKVTALCDVVPAKMEAMRDNLAPNAALFADYHDLLAGPQDRPIGPGESSDQRGSRRPQNDFSISAIHQ